MLQEWGTALLDPYNSFGLWIESTDNELDIVQWAKKYRRALDALLLEHGAIILRNFACDARQFAALADLISPVHMDYRGGNAPRSEVTPGIFTSSELPPSVMLPQHYEMLFAACWPMKLLFYCDIPAASGGETPLTSSRALTKKLDAAVADEFSRRRGVTYVRNFRPNTPFKTLADTFGTTDRNQVEEICRRDGAEYEWMGDDWLQTRQRRPIFRVHPRTGEQCFTATPHLWHRATWIDRLAGFGTGYSADAVAAEDPWHHWMHAFYGDGTDIPDEIIHELYALHEREKITFPWRRGDVMIIENLLAAHGRNAYTGERRVLAALREPYHAERGYMFPEPVAGLAPLNVEV